MNDFATSTWSETPSSPTAVFSQPIDTSETEQTKNAAKKLLIFLDTDCMIYTEKNAPEQRIFPHSSKSSEDINPTESWKVQFFNALEKLRAYTADQEPMV